MSDNPDSPTKKIHQRRWVQVCGACVVIVPVLFMLGLYAAKSYLVDWFKENGADTASIEKLSLNPFFGRLTLNGLDVQVEGKSLLKNAEMMVDVGFGALFKKDIKVQSALYSGLVLDFEQKADGTLRIGSYTIKSSGDEAASDVAEETASNWAFLADNVDLDNCLVKVKTPDLNLELLIEKGELRKFTTREGKAGATVLLEGSINKEPIRIQLSDLQVTPYLRIEGDVKVTKFSLNEIATLLKGALPVFAGDVALDGSAAFTLGDDGAMSVDYSGLIDLEKPDVGSADFATRADNLKWQGTVHFKSGQDAPMVVETDGMLSAQKYALEVPGADFTTSQSVIELEGKNSVTIGENILVENDGRLLVKESDVTLPGNTIQPELLDWKGKVTYNSNFEDAGQYVASTGKLHLGPLALLLGDAESRKTISGKTLTWSGDITYGQESGGVGSYVLLSGGLEGADIGAHLSEVNMVSQQALSFTTDAKISLGETFDITGTNSLDLQGFRYEGGDQGPKVTLAQLAIKDLEGSGNQQLGLQQLDSDGLSIILPGNMPLDIKFPAIKLKEFATEDMSSFSVGSIGLDEPEIIATHNGERLLELDEIKATSLQIDESGQFSAADVSLSNLIFLGAEKGAEVEPFLTLMEATLSKIGWSKEDGLSGDALVFNDLVTTLIKDTSGELNVSQRLSAMRENTEVNGEEQEVEKTENTDDAGMPIRLGRVAVAGKSHVKFEDHTLAVPYLTDLEIKEMELRDLDSREPARKSPFILNAQLEERAPFTVEGDISPFMAPLALNLKIKLKNYPLSRLSSYTVQSVGTALASGQLKLKTKLKLAEDTLDMDNEIILKKLETKTISPELAEELNNQLPIPLDTALSILRDSDRNISLDIPLDGPVSDLDVGISDVLITALSKAIVPAASGYLMYTLGPYGALAYVGMKVGEKMLKVELPPVEFTPGETAIAEERKEYLEKVAEILKGRPETDIQLCPQVVSWEFMDEKAVQGVEGKSIETVEEDREKLIELGQARAEEVQGYLADTYGVDTSRLLICDTLIQTGKSDKPQLMLNL